MPDDIQEAISVRSFWSGVITFGLVSVPVNLFPASRSRGVSLRMLAPDGTPLSRRYYCPAEDRAIDRSEIIRGYEVEDGEFILVSDDELEALEPQKSREIDLRRFVPAEQIDPVYFERAYFLTPAAETTKAYRLLARAMEDTGRAGIATFVMRGREYLIAIIAEHGILRAETLRFHDEIRSPDHVGLPERHEPSGSRVKELVRAIEAAKSKELSEDELSDVYAEKLKQLVDRKLEDEEDVVEAAGVGADEYADVVDLMEVLKRSLQQPVGAGDGGGSADGDASGDGERAAASGAAEDGERERAPRPDVAELRNRTKAELYERARELDIPGRSDMTKDQLIEAIRSAP